MEPKKETLEEFVNRGGQIKKFEIGERRYTEDQIQQMIERKQRNEFYGMPEKNILCQFICVQKRLETKK